jgi:hypothetical protein
MCTILKAPLPKTFPNLYLFWIGIESAAYGCGDDDGDGDDDDGGDADDDDDDADDDDDDDDDDDEASNEGASGSCMLHVAEMYTCARKLFPFSHIKLLP